jgi:hypothetical protein
VDTADIRYWLVSWPLWWLKCRWSTLVYNLPHWHECEENAFWNERYYGRWTQTHDPIIKLFRKPVRRAFIDRNGEYRVIDRLDGKVYHEGPVT